MQSPPRSRVCVYIQQPLHTQRVLYTCVRTHKAERNSDHCLDILDDGEVFRFLHKSARERLSKEHEEDSEENGFLEGSSKAPGKRPTALGRLFRVWGLRN